MDMGFNLTMVSHFSFLCDKFPKMCFWWLSISSTGTTYLRHKQMLIHTFFSMYTLEDTCDWVWGCNCLSWLPFSSTGSSYLPNEQMHILVNSSRYVSMSLRMQFFVPSECVSHLRLYSGLGAAWNVADISKGSTVVIFGLGTVGLSVSIWKIINIFISCTCPNHRIQLSLIWTQSIICMIRLLKEPNSEGHLELLGLTLTLKRVKKVFCVKQIAVLCSGIFHCKSLEYNEVDNSFLLWLQQRLLE